MKFSPYNKVQSGNSIQHEIKEGFKYLLTQKQIMVFVLITATLSMFGMALVTLFPAWAVNILHGDSTTNGFLQSARGVGAVLFALIIATINKTIIRGKMVSYATLLIPVFIIAFSLNSSLIISLTLLIIIGGLMISIYNLSNGLIQTMVSEDFRGRIMSIYSFSFLAFTPLGSLLIGTLAEHFGSEIAILVNGLILLFIYIGIRIYYPKLVKIK
jgi:predicted MFS family arabinose efflux permease